MEKMTGGKHTENFVGCISNLQLTIEKKGEPSLPRVEDIDFVRDAEDSHNVKPCEVELSRLRRFRHRYRRYHIVG